MKGLVGGQALFSGLGMEWTRQAGELPVVLELTSNSPTKKLSWPREEVRVPPLGSTGARGWDFNRGL